MEKILVFGYTMDMGGAEKSLLDTLNYLSNKFDIDLYLLEKKGSLLNELSRNIRIYGLKKNFFLYLLFRYVAFYRKSIINKIAESKDYTCAVGYFEGRSATWVSDIKKNIKKYAWIHCDVDKFDIGITFKEAKRSYNNINKIICVSEEVKTNFCKKFLISSDNVIVINNFINEATIKEKANCFEVFNDTTTFVNVAKMRKEKRQDRLIKAAIELKNKNYKFKIQLIGDGPYLDTIIKMVHDSNLSDVIEILGLQKNPYPYIKNCDYFILPSEHEGYGIVIKEALTLKKRIIVTDTVGPREILKDGRYGVIIPNTDIAVEKVMEDVLENPNKYDYLDKTIAQYKGNNDKIKKKLLQLFER